MSGTHRERLLVLPAHKKPNHMLAWKASYGRNIIGVLGVKEGVEGGNMKGCMEKLLAEALGMDTDNKLEMERWHHSPEWGSAGNDNEKISALVCERKSPESCEGERRSCVEWMQTLAFSRHEQRSSWEKENIVCDKKVRFRPVSPATLHFTWNRAESLRSIGGGQVHQETRLMENKGLVQNIGIRVEIYGAPDMTWSK